MNIFVHPIPMQTTRKNTFTLSLGTNHVPEAMTICSYMVAITKATTGRVCSSLLSSPRIHADSARLRLVN